MNNHLIAMCERQNLRKSKLIRIKLHFLKAFLYCVLIIFIVLLPLFANGQQPSGNTAFDGYLSLMPQYMHADTLNYTQILLHNRLNFYWYPNENLTFSAQFRNQLMSGDFVEMGSFEDGFVSENYFLPLTFQQTFGSQSMLYLSADRFYMNYSKNNLELKIGRQRINWGQTLVWNPNDIFNTYNFFDFDYVERPGADAIRIQYYTGSTSQIDIAAKLDSAANLTAAGLFRFNKQGIDVQLMTGYYSQPYTGENSDESAETDFVAGFGLTTDAIGISMRTEATYMLPVANSPNDKDLFLASIGFDYTLANNLMIMTEFFYSSRINLEGASFFAFYSQPMTVKNLVYTRYNYFIQLSYPVSPLLNTTLAGMIFTDSNLDGFYIGPGADFSITENLDASLFLQYFRFKAVYSVFELKSSNLLGFLRIKWNF